MITKEQRAARNLAAHIPSGVKTRSYFQLVELKIPPTAFMGKRYCACCDAKAIRMLPIGNGKTYIAPACASRKCTDIILRGDLALIDADSIIKVLTTQQSKIMLDACKRKRLRLSKETK